MSRKHSILIIDNGDSLPDYLNDKLTEKGYRVETVKAVNEALEILAKKDPPTFILADRQLDNGLIEKTGELEQLCNAAAPSSEVLVYTYESDLDEEDQHDILNQGAYRVLDKRNVHQLVQNINALIQNFDEILQVTNELQAINTDERSKIITALIGTDVSVSFFDHNFRPPRSKAFIKLPLETTPERTSSGFCQNQCWLSSRKKPALPPKCWGCTVAQAFEFKETRQAIFLNRQPTGYCSWVDVESKPVKSAQNETIIAVRELFTDHKTSDLSNLTSETRLKMIAESLVRIGFGRARIYEFTSTQTAELRAAAAYTDDPFNGSRKYRESCITPLHLWGCKYAQRAHDNSIGWFVNEWDLGPSDLAKELGLELPYFDVPVFSDDRTLCGWISVDFVGLPKELCEQARKDYEKIDTLTWLSEEYGREVRIALEATERDKSSQEKWEIVRRVQFGIAGSTSMKDSVAIILQGCRELLPNCRVAVRILEGNELRECHDFAQNPWVGGRPNISMENPHSLSVAVAKRMFPHWIDDYPNHLLDAKKRNDPGWFQPDGTQSTAQVPLIIEGIVLGTLSISSPKYINWKEEHLTGPILYLAQCIGWVVRDIKSRQEIDKAMSDRAAVLAFSMKVAEAGLWRHATQQRLTEISVDIATIRQKMKNRALTPEELENALLEISGTIARIGAAPPVEESRRVSSIEETFSRLLHNYDDRVPQPTFTCIRNYNIEAPSLVLKNVLTILIDNAVWSIRNSGVGSSIAVDASANGEYVNINVIDDGPGIPVEIQENIFRDRVESTKKGQGLGLLYARGFALQYGGDLTFTSQPGQTKFCLTLPLNK